MITLKIAFRNILAHKVKTAIIGSIIVFGTTLAIVGNSVVDAVANGMQNSLTQSVTGDIQIYSSGAKEKLSVLGSMDGSMPDIGHVNSFAKVRDTLVASVPNIRTVTPMGTNVAFLSPGNLLDVKLEELRGHYHRKQRDEKSIVSLKGHVRSILVDIEKKLTASRATMNKVLAKDQAIEDAPKHLTKALAPAFWADFDANAESRIEFLANTMAPLIFDDSMLFLSYLGSVPGQFQKAFSQFEVVKGQEIPEGRRGFLFSDYFYETQIKHRVARRLDTIRKRIDKSQITIAANKSQQDLVAANVAQASEIYTQIAPDAAKRLIPKLQKLVESKSDQLDVLTREFLATTDANLTERYKFFYDEIAPHIILYKVRVGDVFPITAFGKTGYSTSVNMKVYGTYRFKSFESSPIAGNFNVMDMMSFRELFGFMTAEKRAETQALEAEMGLKDVGRDSIEDMFNANKPAPQMVKPISLSKALPSSFGKFEERRRIFERAYSATEMEDGVFLNAAVLLKDQSQIQTTMREIEKVAKENGLEIQVVDWKDSAGMIGQMTVMVRAVLFFLVFITFTIATFVIMNSMMMATLERTREIGTMRAIGAQRGFLATLFLTETTLMAFIFGAIGTAIGVLIILTVGSKGIPSTGDPATGDVAAFFFSGDKLFFYVNPIHILVVFGCMTLVAIISTQYPAWRAMRISPLEAMQKND